MTLCPVCHLKTVKNQEQQEPVRNLEQRDCMWRVDNKAYKYGLKEKPWFGDFLSVLWNTEPKVFSFHIPCSLGIIGIFCQTQDYLIFIFQRANILCELWLPNNGTLKAPLEEKRKEASLHQISLCTYLSELISLEALHLLILCQGCSQQAFLRQSPRRGLLLWEKGKHPCICCYYHILLRFQF